METFLHILHLLAGPVVGAIIGIFTNYIAVKMLFHPYKEWHIGKFRVPYTPGIIPRRQEALALALGHAVSESLVKRDDLKNVLLSDGVSATVVDSILSLPPVKDAGVALLGEEYEARRNEVLSSLTDHIADGIAALDIEAFIRREGAAAIANFAPRNPLVGMFLNESTVNTYAGPIAERIKTYLEGDGREKLRGILENEYGKIEEKPVGKLFGEPEELAPLLKRVYTRLISEHADAIVTQFHIDKIVEKKVKEMPPEGLEALVLSIMRKELNAVICLGGVIGLILGILTTVLSNIG